MWTSDILKGFVRPSVRRSVGPSVCWSVGPSLCEPVLRIFTLVCLFVDGGMKKGLHVPAYPSGLRRYRVINLDWEEVLSFCSQLLLLTGLEIVFFCSTMFDVFCIKILLV